MFCQAFICMLQRALQCEPSRVLTLNRDDPPCQALQRGLSVGKGQLLQALEMSLPGVDEGAALMLDQVVRGCATFANGFGLVRPFIANLGFYRDRKSTRLTSSHI